MKAAAPRRQLRLRVVLAAVVAIFTFAGLPAVANAADLVNLDQCANDLNNDKSTGQCGMGTDAKWQNGSLNDQNSTYFEGDSVPFRARFSGLTVGNAASGPFYTITIEHEYHKGGKYAYDYLTSWNATYGGDPCGFDTSGPNTVTPCPAVVDSTTAIPGGTGFFECRGCDMVSATTGPVSASGQDVEHSVVVQFYATVTNPILLWGGHLAKDSDHAGVDNGAADISGAPFHMRTTSFVCSNDRTCSAGNEDRSIQPGAIESTPAAVTFRSATATATGKGVMLRWRVGAEVDVLGYNVYRQVGAKRIKVNRRLVASASLSGARTRASYSFLDRNGLRSNRAPVYWIQAVNADGSRTLYGPISVLRGH